jgi:NADH-quinone oxidoreductase subunit N
MTSNFTAFKFTVAPADWVGIAPLVVLVIMALVVMLIDLLLPHAGERSKHTGPANFIILPIVSLIGLLGAIAATIVLLVRGTSPQVFNYMVAADAGTLYAYLLILVAGVLGILLSPAYLKRLELVHQGEYYALLMFAMTGMMLLAAATSFLIVFVGLEMLSLALYILCAFVARRRSSQEAGMKYFLLSSFASAFLLYGIALTYAATGHTAFSDIETFLKSTHTAHASVLLLVALGLLAVGFAFKVSAVPFQAWTPDVYQGAPAPVTAFMSVGTKVAALIAFIRVFGFMFLSIRADWMPIISALAIVTIVGGNVMALGQSNVKRLLAYSSIAHGGYLLIGIVVGYVLGASAILFYLSSYLFMNLGAFGVISLLERLDNTGYDVEELRGLWYRRPVVAGLLAFFLLSLAGFPPMAGFAAKYYLFYAALQGGHPELLIIGVLASILGIYYYLRPIATMFMTQSEDATLAEQAQGTAPARGLPPMPRTVTKASTGSTRRTGGLASTGGAAVAVKSSPAKVETPSPVPQATETTETQETTGPVGFTWLALALAAIGTLVVGVVLPIWLPNIQQAAQMLLK